MKCPTCQHVRKKDKNKSAIFQFLIVFSFVMLSHGNILAATAKITIEKNESAKGHYLYFGLAKDFIESGKKDLDKADLGANDSYLASDLMEGATYYFVATAYDHEGNESAFSGIWSYTVPGKNIGGGRLAGFSTMPPPNLNLSSEGTLDWAHWGLSTESNFNHKLKASQRISNFTRIGNNPPKRFTAGRVAFSWNLGTPTIGGNGTTTGIYVDGFGNGFQLSVPADTIARTFRIYIGSYKARSRLEASLSDGSAEPYVIYIDSPNSSIDRVVTLNYTASGPADLIVKYTRRGSSGSIGLQAATLNETANVDPPIYTISASTGSVGTISPSGNVKVPFGGSQSFTITPGTGKKIKDVMVDGKSVGATNRFTFSSVVSNRSISANFEIVPEDSTRYFVETGEVFVDQNWQRVDFTGAFIHPVVVAKPAGMNDPDPAVVRIRKVNETGFDIRIQEWDYQDGFHDFENVSYLVVEKGSYILPGGIKMQAGMFEAGGQGFRFNPFVESFNHIPVVLVSVTSTNQESAVDGRIHNVSADGFEYLLQEQESNKWQDHGVETVSFIALEPFSGVLNGLAIEAGTTDAMVGDAFHYISYTEPFLTIPLLLSDMQTAVEPDTCNLRYRGRDVYSVELHISEEQSKDAELSHANETIGYLFVADPY